jgi:hypothetical protein
MRCPTPHVRTLKNVSAPSCGPLGSIAHYRWNGILLAFLSVGQRLPLGHTPEYSPPNGTDEVLHGDPRISQPRLAGGRRRQN